MDCKKLSIDFSQKDLFVDVFQDKVYVVGGAVRDFLIYGKIADRQDIDLVVVDCTYDQIEAKLRRFGKTDNVGKSFAVVKFTRERKTFDIADPPPGQKETGGFLFPQEFHDRRRPPCQAPRRPGAEGLHLQLRRRSADRRSRLRSVQRNQGHPRQADFHDRPGKFF